MELESVRTDQVALKDRKSDVLLCVFMKECESTQIPLHRKAQPRDEYTQSGLRRNFCRGAPNNGCLFIPTDFKRC